MSTDIKNPELKKPTPAVPGKEHDESGLHQFLIDALKDIYWAEQELVKALPVLIDAVTTEELSSAIAEHLTETENHVARLEEVFHLLGRMPEGKTCFAMQGLIKEAHSIAEETTEGTAARDAAIILAAQKVEHYEIATYGALVEYAKTIGRKDVHGILQLTLEEERMADQGLTLIAQNKINWEAEVEPMREAASTV